MKKILNLLLLLTLPLLVNGQISDNMFENTPSWREEFSKSGHPSESNWILSKWQNTEQVAVFNSQSLDNVFVKRRKLNLRARKVKGQDHLYETGRLESAAHVKFRYGKLQVRAKCPTASGCWDAIWMRPLKSKSKVKGEIDIMEYFSGWKGKKFQTNFHFWGEFGGKKHNHVQYPKYINADVNKWHVYTLEWSPTELRVKMDDIVCYDLKKGGLSEWPWDEYYQLILALAYGRKSELKTLDDSALPQTLQVDWVRYYKYKEQ